MTTLHLDGVSVSTQASVYFDGKCISHGITFPDGTKKSVGVILPATLTFNTGASEVLECVAGSCEYRLAGTEAALSQAEQTRVADAARAADLAARLAGTEAQLSDAERARLAEAAAAEALRQRLAGIDAELTEAEKTRLADLAADAVVLAIEAHDAPRLAPVIHDHGMLSAQRRRERICPRKVSQTFCCETRREELQYGRRVQIWRIGVAIARTAHVLIGRCCSLIGRCERALKWQPVRTP